MALGTVKGSASALWPRLRHRDSHVGTGPGTYTVTLLEDSLDPVEKLKLNQPHLLKFQCSFTISDEEGISHTQGT